MSYRARTRWRWLLFGPSQRELVDWRADIAGAVATARKAEAAARKSGDRTEADDAWLAYEMALQPPWLAMRAWML